uniref:F-box domain-containing protein n=1 Tax=Globisporangium ultimum (strain ATCC 200006 / CBS 805.95 / DAOM BR144) TaxID=431595 RepID=K3WL40_GLOUD
MAPLMDTIALKYENPLVAVLSAATAAVAPMPRSPTTCATTAPPPFKKAHRHFTVQDLPAVVVQLICAFVDHKTLHAVEKTSGELYEIVQQSGYSSADRPSETPINTLSHSKCWSEIRPHLESSALQNPHELHDVAAFGMSLGERIQLKCGCSTGNSCYWSSSASSDKHATDYIDYNLNEPCVVSCVQILPYRVFWHPGSPTYAPEKVYFEFYDASALQPVANQDYDVMADDIGAPFYQSPLYDVQNDMRLQDFVLPRKVVTSNSTVLRVKLVGRHQAQTFELPPWLQRTPEDRLPKYYCCISYVNVLGLHCVPSARGSNEIAPIKEQSIRMANSLVEYVTSYYEGVMGDMRRRGQ